ncbi:hypothetical protein MTsN3n11_05760 [Qipengyuania sp. MTN3-11]
MLFADRRDCYSNEMHDRNEPHSKHAVVRIEFAGLMLFLVIGLVWVIVELFRW